MVVSLSAISAFGKWRKEGQMIKASLGCMKFCIQKEKKNKDSEYTFI